MFGRRLRLLCHFCVAGVVLVALAHVAGLPSLLAALHGADRTWFGVATGTSLLAVAAWGVGLYVITATDDEQAGRATFTQAHLAGLFVRNIVPWGNAGGAVFTGYVLSRATDASFERTLASVVTWEFVNTLASLAVAVVGLAVFTGSQSSAGTPLRVLAVVGVVTALVVAAIVIVQYRRGWVVWAVLALAGSIRKIVGSVSPRARRVLADEHLERRLDRFFWSVEQAVADRRAIWRGLGAALAAWVLLAVALVASFHAVGASLGLAAACVVLPLAGLATILPLPGGLGGVEFALGAFLFLLTGLGAATVGAGVLLYRLASFGLMVSLGGAALVPGSLHVPLDPDDLDVD